MFHIPFIFTGDECTPNTLISILAFDLSDLSGIGSGLLIVSNLYLIWYKVYRLKKQKKVNENEED